MMHALTMRTAPACVTPGPVGGTAAAVAAAKV